LDRRKLSVRKTREIIRLRFGLGLDTYGRSPRACRFHIAP